MSPRILPHWQLNLWQKQKVEPFPHAAVTMIFCMQWPQLKLGGMVMTPHSEDRSDRGHVNVGTSPCSM
jgi:hypothetical protein